jgi:hypothetical protein
MVVWGENWFTKSNLSVLFKGTIQCEKGMFLRYGKNTFGTFLATRKRITSALDGVGWRFTE